jgi:chaperonin GroEL (HSP60 family)
MRNAGEKAELRLGQILEQPVGYGYNLRNMTDKPIDLREEGIIDPAMVIKEVVRNAASIAGILATLTVIMPFSDPANDTMLNMMSGKR